MGSVHYIFQFGVSLFTLHVYLYGTGLPVVSSATPNNLAAVLLLVSRSKSALTITKGPASGHSKSCPSFLQAEVSVDLVLVGFSPLTARPNSSPGKSLPSDTQTSLKINSSGLMNDSPRSIHSTRSSRYPEAWGGRNAGRCYIGKHLTVLAMQSRSTGGRKQ